MNATATAHAPIVYNFLEDPGHGWLVVELTELRDLGIVNAISGYSYVSPGRRYVYLEEDCDLATFAAAKTRAGEAWRIERTHTNHDCHVRGFPHYSASSNWAANAAAIAKEVSDAERDR